MPRACLHCGASIEHRQWNAKYCSDEHREAAAELRWEAKHGKPSAYRQPLASTAEQSPPPPAAPPRLTARERQAATSPCYRCRQPVPRHELVRQQLPRGHGGRRHTGYVLMCGSCAGQQQSDNRTTAIIVLVVLALILLLFVALGIPLTKSLTKAH